MSVCQPPHQFAFNHAHSEYLQLAVEGGMLVGVPMVCAAFFAFRLIVARLRSDHTPTFWMRVGARQHARRHRRPERVGDGL